MVTNQKDMNIVNKQTLNDLKFIHNNYYGKNFLKNKKILITGAGGFVGYYLSLYLIKYKKELKIKKILLTDIKIKNILPKIKFFKKTANIAIKKFDVIKDNIIETVNTYIMNIIKNYCLLQSNDQYKPEDIYQQIN
jgi:FlaA1/EpsC-like NDP-sugar epimerase